MEIAIWTFIVIVLVALFKTLKFEKYNSLYDERQLLTRYFEIKKINPDSRVAEFKVWEKAAQNLIEQNKNKKVDNIIKFKVFDNTKQLS